MSMPPPPPMTYIEPGMQPTRTSAAAVTSLITGILGCLVVTGIVAIITGIIGIYATKKPQVKGRGLAIAGLILGLLTTICSIGIGSVGVWFYLKAGSAIITTTSLIDATSTGDINKAMPYVDESKVSRVHLQEVIDELKPLGKPTGFTPAHRSMSSGYSVIDLDGTLNYPNNVSKAVSFQLTKQADGSYKVTKLDLD